MSSTYSQSKISKATTTRAGPAHQTSGHGHRVVLLCDVAVEAHGLVVVKFAPTLDCEWCLQAVINAHPLNLPNVVTVETQGDGRDVADSWVSACDGEAVFAETKKNAKFVFSLISCVDLVYDL